MAPLFQNIGAGAYKEGLGNTLMLDEHFHHPHRSYRTIHVAGTNGKGSVSHTLAAILQSAGYRVGLYTSPHLLDFRERIRVDGQMISEQRVVDFVSQEKDFFESLHPSFFEFATALAFQYFAEQHVDVAVVEVGLGGRLDCTNIITPDLSVITNISLDHTQFLGGTLEQIASEKAGIIKPNVPVVVGECVSQPGVRDVFLGTAERVGAPVFLAEHDDEITSNQYSPDGWRLSTRHFGDIHVSLAGSCQLRNAVTVLAALKHLDAFGISPVAVQEGFRHVCELTGLMGRWQTVAVNPTVICDTGHNVGGWQYLSRQLMPVRNLHIVMGMVSDKDVNHVLSLMPRHARYYFTAAHVQRAMPARQFADAARAHGLHGDIFDTVEQAAGAAIKNATPNGMVFVGGSTFIVADYLLTMHNR